MNDLIDLNYLNAFKTFFLSQYLRINEMMLILMLGLIISKHWTSSVITINGGDIGGIFAPTLFMGIDLSMSNFT
ncbi:MAG: hypothetical protein ABI045_06190 [Flavobacteriales bacterium]